jgi:O-antigen/teichoic acid export membrane protein
MVPIIAGLALAMPFFAVQIVCSPATNALGRPRIYVVSSLVGAVIFPCAFLFGISDGPMGLVHAWWFAAPTLLVATLALTLPAVGVRLVDLLKELLPPLVACALMAGCVYLAKPLVADLAAPIRLLVLVPIGGLTYGAAMWFLWPSVIRESWAMLRKKEEIASETSLAT